jgi:hypothetical protein
LLAKSPASSLPHRTLPCKTRLLVPRGVPADIPGDADAGSPRSGAGGSANDRTGDDQGTPGTNTSGRHLRRSWFSPQKVRSRSASPQKVRRIADYSGVVRSPADHAKPQVRSHSRASRAGFRPRGR